MTTIPPPLEETILQLASRLPAATIGDWVPAVEYGRIISEGGSDFLVYIGGVCGSAGGNLLYSTHSTIHDGVRCIGMSLGEDHKIGEVHLLKLEGGWAQSLRYQRLGDAPGSGSDSASTSASKKKPRGLYAAEDGWF